MNGLGNTSRQLVFFWNQFKRYLKEKKYRYYMRNKSNMKINIISPDSKSGWIIYKFGISVFNQLQELGYEVSLSDKFDSLSDINHYFLPNNIGYSSMSKVDKHTTFMITHVDTILKLNQIKELTDKGAIGVCMSLETRDKLIASGVRRNRICYINPAQDGQLKPKKINLGFTYMVHNDSRKRDDIVLDICKEIDPEVFKFVIMGAGWDKIVEGIKDKGFEVDYYAEFDKTKYNELIPQLDYYCYFGFDEGSMGFLDAMAAGVGTIVTPQGYHLDTDVGITYPVRTLKDIIEALLIIERNRKRYIEFANTWTWKNYTLKHLEIWKYMLGAEKLEVLLSNRGRYLDGIFSLMLDDLAYHESLIDKIKKIE